MIPTAAEIAAARAKRDAAQAEYAAARHGGSGKPLLAARFAYMRAQDELRALLTAAKKHGVTAP